MKRAIVSVINDLSTDQRVHKHCLLLQQAGFEVELVGRLTPTSAPLPPRGYATKRFSLPFWRGPLFYAAYNMRLFLHLLFSKYDLLFSNDLDTLLPNYLASLIKGIPLVYDSHELFTEVPELDGRPWVKRVWVLIEKNILPKLKYVFTVNQSIAQEYNKRYGVKMTPVRNIPSTQVQFEIKNREQLGLPTNTTLIILQGAGINMHRGAEEAVEAMRYVENAHLLIIGSGDVMEKLGKICTDPTLAGKVTILGRKPYAELMQYTAVCDIGLTLDRDTNLNYRFSLPNKVFDYIRAGIAVLATNLPEVSAVVNGRGVGMTIDLVTPLAIAKAIDQMRGNPELLARWKENSILAAQTLTWENEARPLLATLKQLHG